MKQPPCYGCEGRNPECHISCPGYTEFKIQRDKELEKMAKERRRNSDVNDHIAESVHRNRKANKRYERRGKA